MEYPYLTLLGVTTLIFTLFIGIVIFYFLVRLFNREIKFSMALRGILLYQFSSLILYLVYPTPFLAKISPSTALKILDLLIFSSILFLIFYFVTRRYFVINWKKSLVLFVILIFVLFPALSFYHLMVTEKLTDLPIFAEESLKLYTQIKEWWEGGGIWFLGLPPEPLSFKIIGKIESGILSLWPSVRIREILLTIP